MMQSNKIYKFSRYAEIERQPNGRFVVYNLVTGVSMKAKEDDEEATEYSYQDAKGLALTLSDHYRGVAKQAGWVY